MVAASVTNTLRTDAAARAMNAFMMSLLSLNLFDNHHIMHCDSKEKRLFVY